MKQLYFYMFFSILVLMFLSNSADAENWPGWRGPRGDGTSMEKNVPIRWDADSNIVWKTAVPGEGHASPIVWEDCIFTVTALPDKQQRVLLCFERTSGDILWQKTVLVTPLESKRPDNSYASGTPVTDGDKIYVIFQDDEQVVAAAYDFSGNQLWLVRPGPYISPHGWGSSPVLYKDKVIINCGNKGDSYVVALSRDDGKTLWKIPQRNSTLSYSSPYICEMAGRTQMVICGDKNVAGYNPDDGSLYWMINGPSDEFCATPVFHEQAGLVFVSSSYPRRYLLAIKPDGSKNVTDTHIAWRTTEGAPYVPSPICQGEFLLTTDTQGQVYCHQAATGKLLWKKKLGRQYSSPVSANGLVYIQNDDGLTNVIRPAEEFTPVAQNNIGEKTFPSLAISQGRIFLRSDKHLFCIGQSAK
jgi:outer membrane protein assembly factor BamB